MGSLTVAFFRKMHDEFWRVTIVSLYCNQVLLVHILYVFFLRMHHMAKLIIINTDMTDLYEIRSFITPVRQHTQ